MRSQIRVLGHPLHPTLVFLPLAAFPIALLFDVLAWSGVVPGLWTAGFVVLAAGLLVTLAAIVPGVADLARVPDGTRAHAVGMWHAGVGVLIAVLYAVALFVRWPLGAEPAPLVPTLVDVAGTLAVTAQGWLGGEMVYTHHVGVKEAGEGGDPVSAEDAVARPRPGGAVAGERRR